jgi:excisionase family DNA binding protein
MTNSSNPKGFDPLAYIESAFVDQKPESESGKEKSSNAEPIQVATHAITDTGKIKFKKRQLSAPRPRRNKNGTAVAVEQNSEVEELWQNFPKYIHFLGAFFNDDVTSHYYRGEFKETRQELIRRLLDPELSLEEASRLLGVCPATVRRYTNRKWLAHHRTKGGQRRFRLSGLVKFVEQHGRHPEE